MDFFKKKKTEEVTERNQLQTIKSYLFTRQDFSKAYSTLKSRYIDNYLWACDALDLVEKGDPVYINGSLLAVELCEGFRLVACENCTMMIELVECE